MKKRLSTIFLILVFLAGLSLLLYPTVSDYWNSLHQSRAIATYNQDIAAMETDDYTKAWSDAEAYNRVLFEKVGGFTMTEEEKAEYESLLNVGGTGIMGYVEIPAIGCSLPIYHGTEDAVLQTAIGHLEWSSLPVGGVSTHCVISGHRGLPSAKLFTNLDQLMEGDIFMLQVLNETLTYEVDQILIVEPHELDALGITEGEDYCTLVTCTPYGVNSHRLLVRGHRIENLEEAGTVRVTSDAIQIEPLLVAPLLAVPLLLVLLVLLFVRGGKKKK